MKLSTREKFIYLSILSVIFVVVESTCPSKCNCTDTEVHCVKKGIQNVPNFDILENDPLIIDLSGNRITLIGYDDFSFEKSEMVKEIYLNNSELVDIENEAFDDMENLQELYLGENLISYIPADFIQDLPNMVLLDLSGNPFEGDMPIIRSDTLEVLVLVNCKITNISEDALKYLPSLRLLLLNENNIQYIDPKIFDSLSYFFFIRLSYNTWECNCQTMELFNYLSKKRYIDLEEPYQCYNGSKFINVHEFNKSVEYKNMCNVTTGNSETIEENNKKQEVGKRNLVINTEQTNSVPYEIPTHDVVDEKHTIKNEENIIIFNTTKNNEEGFAVSLNIVLIATLCFVVGILFGFFLNKFITTKNHLESSDSTAKLLASKY